MIVLNAISGRGHGSYVWDVHNHELLEKKHSSMLPAHRTLREGEILGMNIMRKADISTHKMYDLFADQAGGYENNDFIKKDLQNQITKQKKMDACDGKAILVYLKGLESWCCC